MAGRVFRITKDSTWILDVPLHEGYRYTPMVNPESCPGTQVECCIGEFQPGSRVLDHSHAEEDNLFYIVSGRATARVGNEVHSLEPGDVLWVPKGEVHNFELLGGEGLRSFAIFSPARPVSSGG